MTWSKLDDGFSFHPKVIMAGNEGAGIFARCLSYCGKYNTDGKVPAQVALNIAVTKRALENVVGVGLLRELPSGDFHISDYLDYNPPSDEVEARREARREAGRLGGLASGKARSKP